MIEELIDWKRFLTKIKLEMRRTDENLIQIFGNRALLETLILRLALYFGSRERLLYFPGTLCTLSSSDDTLWPPLCQRQTTRHTRQTKSN